MLEIQYQCLPKLQLKGILMFLPKLQFAGVSIANLREKKPSYTNDITVNPIQKGTEVFIVVIGKTCPGLYENILNF